MPPIPKTSPRPKPAVPSDLGNGNGFNHEAPLPEEDRLDEMLRQATLGSDEIEIGATCSPLPEKLSGVEAATMEDVSKLIAAVKFLVREWIPFGMVTGLIAEPGVGKSAFALWLARTVMTAELWFNGRKGPKEPGYVLWIPTENDMAATLDRMSKWDIPSGRLILPFKDDPLRAANLTDNKHLEIIAALVIKYKTPLVVVDSLRGSHDGDENQSTTGRILLDLGQIAQGTGASFTVVHHTKKLGIGEEIVANSSRGSNSIIAIFRSMIGFDRPDPKSKWVRIRVLKENLGLAPKPLGMLVTNTGLKFGEAPRPPRKESKKEGAKEWLANYMVPGTWYPVKPTEELMIRFGFSSTAIQGAREELGITTALGNCHKTPEGAWEMRRVEATAGSF